MGHRFVDARVIRRRMDEKDVRMQREMARRTASHEPLVRSCANCQYFDGDAFCALPAGEQLISGGYIRNAALVVCAKHEAKERD